MSERERQQLLEGQEDDLLQDLFDDAMGREGEARLNADESEDQGEALPKVPKELDAQCRELIRAAGRKHERVQFFKRAGAGLKRAAIVALVLICFVSTLVMSVDAIRLPVLNFLVNNRYSTIYFRKKPLEGKELRLMEKVISIPLPDGYRLADESYREDGSFSLLFENDEALTLQVSYIAAINLVNYDTEDAEQTQMKILGQDAIFIKKDGLRIVWVNETSNGIFDIKANGLNEEEFWEYVMGIAESIAG